VNSLRKRRIPEALLWQHAFGAALTAFLSGIPSRTGYARHGRRLLLTRAAVQGPEELAAHEVFSHLRLVREAGLPAPFSLPRLPAPPAASPAGTAEGGGPPGLVPGQAGLRPGRAVSPPCRKAEALLPGLEAWLSGRRGFLLALAPGASYGGAKRWPAASFASAARLILEGRRGEAVILGGEGELEACLEAERLLQGGPPCRNLAGKTDLAMCARILSEADLALTNDSGLMHLACALGAPAVAPFGPTDPAATGPLGLRSAVLRSPVPCSPCLRRECPRKERICFAGITPRLAAEAAERLLEAPSRALPSTGRPGRPAVFAGGLPREAFLASEDLPVIFALSPRAAADRRLEPPERARAWPFDPAFSRASRPFPGGKADAAPAPGPAPQASFAGLPAYLVPEGSPQGFFRDLCLRLGVDPARSFWLGPSLESLAPARALGGKAALWLGKGSGLPEDVLQGDWLPGVVAPGFQQALDWAGAVR
jgi:heptosyltransferase-2